MTTQKINGVYCVSNALGGGMKNVSRTRAESQSMNGEVSVFELNKPQPYEVFSSWPDDIQKEYLKKLYWTHGGTLKKIGGLFGFSHMWAKDKFDSLGIPTMSHAEANRAVLDRAKKWEAFLRGGTCIKDVIPDETAQKLETFKNEKPVLMPAPPETKQVKTDTDADARQALLFAIEHLVHHDGAHVKIEITL